jgi:hypothetical protein
MIPTPDIPCWTYDVNDSRHVAQMRALLAALIIFLVCVFVISAHV